jgi:hypothetical protein
MRHNDTIPMSPTAALLIQLRDLKQLEENADVESTQVRKSWLEVVENLLSANRLWLKAASAEGLARIDAASVHVDDDAGAYDAPALKIAFPGGRIVWVRPVGTLRVGAQGIVDVVCGSSRALLVLNRAGVWKVRGPRPTGALALLDEESFARTIAELIL